MEPEVHELTGIDIGGSASVQLTPELVACARHLEPFRDAWPEGFEEFALLLLDTVINDQRFMSTVEGELLPILRERPLCERVHVSDLHLAYLSIPICHDGTCSLCSTVGPGTTYRSARPGGGVIEYEHLCLDCMLTRFRPLN